MGSCGACAGEEALLPLELALVKPKQECSLVLSLGIALLLLSRVMNIFKTAAYFKLIHYGS